MSKKYFYQVKPLTKSAPTALKNYSVFEKKLTSLLASRTVTTQQEFNTILREIKKLSPILSLFHTSSQTFKDELLLVKKRKPLTESTVWGGVILKKVDVAKDFIQKLLVIKKFGVLGFEIHKKKEEHLKILEGYCLVFYINHQGKKNNTITVQLGSVGDKFTFAPNDEHGILTLSDCIIEETSTNHLDDLVYIFPASLS